MKCVLLIWLAIQDALPTNACRFKQGMTTLVVCAICNSVEETILHCLRDCPMAMSIWTQLRFDTSSTLFRLQGQRAWMRDLLIDSNSVASSTSWWIWRAMSSFCMENIQFNHHSLASSIAAMTDDLGHCFGDPPVVLDHLLDLSGGSLELLIAWRLMLIGM